MIKPIRLLLIIISIFSFASCQKEVNKEKSKSSNLNAEIDNYASEITNRYNIPGISLAVIKNGEVLHRKNYGKANIEHNVSVSDSSVFRVYSLTKPIVATAIFQLIEQNKLTLDDDISKHLNDLPTSWQSVKVKNLLRHSSGLPEIKVYDKLPEQEAKTNVYNDTINFVQETHFQYNQTNYWLLLRIIEKLTNEKIEDFIIDNQFGKRGKEGNVFFSTDSRDIYPNRVSLYFPFETGKMQTVNHYREDYITSANGLNINLSAFLNWDSNFTSNQLIKHSSKNSMWESIKYDNDFRKWAYGWNEYILNDHKSYGFSGSMVTVYRNFPEEWLFRFELCH